MVPAPITRGRVSNVSIDRESRARSDFEQQAGSEFPSCRSRHGLPIMRAQGGVGAWFQHGFALYQIVKCLVQFQPFLKCLAYASMLVEAH